jgi:hypothetical protein
MSFTSTFNSLSINGWSAKNNNGYTPIYVLANANVGYDVAMSKNGGEIIASNPFLGLVKGYAIVNNTLSLNLNIVGAPESGQVVGSFGSSIDIDYTGDRIVVGSITNGISNNKAGSARIYLNGGFETQINPPNANTFQFGYNVSINNAGDKIVVGQNYIGGGGNETVYTYSRSGTTWSLLANIPTPTADIFFASSIAMDGNNTIVIGANRANTNGTFSGAAYVYHSNGTLLTTLLASDGAASDSFGTTVNISNDGNTIVVTAPGANSSSGAAYIYKGSGNSWTEIQKIVKFGDETGQFGVAVGPTRPVINGTGANIAIYASYLNYGPNTTANYTSLLTFIDSNQNNNWISTQQILYPAVQYFGAQSDTSYDGRLIITSGGNNSTTGTLILLGQ